jgi:phenylacetate-CoA ligase
MGRADQTTKVRGMFVQPSQVNKILENLYLNNKARLIVSRLNEKDELHIKIEADISNSTELSSIKTKISEQIKHIINLRGTVEIVPVNSLPNDGKVIDDIRDFGE